MTPVAVLLYVVHVMSKDPGEEFWHNNIMALMIIADVVLFTPMLTTWRLFVLTWVGLAFNFLAYLLCYYLLIE